MNFDFLKPKLRDGRLESVLGEIERADFVRRLNEVDATYSFKHVLIQETAYASLLRQDRRALHRHIADSCEQLFAGQLDEYLALLAFHYDEAGETAKAVSYWMRYGERAMQIGAYPEAIHAFKHALVLVPDVCSERARALTQLGEVFARRSDLDLAEEHFRDGLATAIAVDDARIAAMALTGVARVSSQRGEHVRARQLGQEALRWAIDSRDQEAIARAHRQLGVAFNYEGDNAAAQTHLEMALALFRERQDLEGVGSCLNSLGVIARDLNELERAGILFQEAVTLARQLGDRYATGVRLVNLGVIAEQRGDFEAAERYQNQALAITQEIGDREGSALILINQSSLTLTRGDVQGAYEMAQRALQTAMSLGSLGLAYYVLAFIAKIKSAQGNWIQAAEFLGLAFAHPSSTADVKNDFQDVRAGLETKLTRRVLEEAMQRGATRDLQAVARELASGRAHEPAGEIAHETVAV